DVKPAPRGTDVDSVDQLIKALDHPAHSERLRAQRALIAKGKDVLDPLLKVLDKEGLSPRGQRHALWVLRAFDWPQWPQLCMSLMSTQADDLIYNAIRVLDTYDRKGPHGDEKTAFRIAADLITTIDNDSTPANRLQAALAMERVATPKWCKDVIYELG